MKEYITYELVDKTAGIKNVTEENNQYIFEYPCKSHFECTNYELTIRRGTYLVELYGASGGYVENYITSYRNSKGECPTIDHIPRIRSNVECSTLQSVAGSGGYTSGVITLHSTTTAFLAIGGQGTYRYMNSKINNNADCFKPENMVKGGYNGGGWASNYYFSSRYNGAASGGGSTDLRFEVDDVFHRVIVAGAGGGTDDAIGGSDDDGSGGSGGGLTAQSFRIKGILNTIYVANQTSGFTFGSGESAQQTGSKNTEKGCPYSGSTYSDIAGSGSGWFGGFASHHHGGGAGGGSSFILTKNAEVPREDQYLTYHDTFYNELNTSTYAFSKKDKYLFTQAVMYPGVWDGHGFAIITLLSSLTNDKLKCTTQKSFITKQYLFVSISLPSIYMYFS